MRRRLGNMEHALHLTNRFAPLRVAGVVRMRNAPSADQLGEALATLQNHHPLLRAHIAGDRRPEFVVGDVVPPISLVEVLRRDDDHWLEVTTAELNRVADAAIAPLMSAILVCDPNDPVGAAELLFFYDHSIMDASSACHIYDQVLRLCSGDLSADELMPLDLPASIDELLPDRLRGTARLVPLARFMREQAADEIHYQRSIKGRHPAIHDDASCLIASRSLDKDQTAELVSNARRQRIAMNAVVCASLIRSTYEARLAPETIPMRHITFADLRSGLQSVPPGTLGCYIAMLRHTIDLSPDDDLWTVAAKLQACVHPSVKADHHLLGAGMAKQLMTMILKTKRMRMATTAVSYAGPLNVRTSYGDIEVINVHGIIANNRLGPMAAGFAKIFDGSLSWDFLLLDTDFNAAEVETLADATLHELITGLS